MPAKVVIRRSGRPKKPSSLQGPVKGLKPQSKKKTSMSNRSNQGKSRKSRPESDKKKRENSFLKKLTAEGVVGQAAAIKLSKRPMSYSSKVGGSSVSLSILSQAVKGDDQKRAVPKFEDECADSACKFIYSESGRTNTEMWKKHYKDHHGSQLQALNTGMERRQRLKVCPDCNKIFSVKTGLTTYQNHIDRTCKVLKEEKQDELLSSETSALPETAPQPGDFSIQTSKQERIQMGIVDQREQCDHFGARSGI
jgi:hypothetical protein